MLSVAVVANPPGFGSEKKSLDFISLAGYKASFLSDAGWSSLVARRAHNPKVAGSNPAPATNLE